MASRIIPIAPAVVFQGINNLGKLRHYQDKSRSIPGYTQEGDAYAINTFFRYGRFLHGAGVRILPMPSFCGGSVCHAGHTWKFVTEFDDSWPDYEEFGHRPEDIAEASLASAVISHMVDRRKTSYGANGRHGNFHHRMWCKMLKRKDFVPWENLAHYNGWIQQIGDPSLARNPRNQDDADHPISEDATPLNSKGLADLRNLTNMFGRALPKPAVHVVDDLWNLNSDNKCWWSVLVFDEECVARDIGDRELSGQAVCDECGHTVADGLDGEDCMHCEWGRYIVSDGDGDSAEETRLTFCHGKERPRWTKRHVPFARDTLEKLRTMNVRDPKARMMVGKY